MMMFRSPIFSIISLIALSFLLITTPWSFDRSLNSVPSDEPVNQYLSIPSDENIEHLCNKYFWNTKTSLNNDPTPPIYDFILFSSEFDTLEIRLYELYNYVTLFFIAESTHTLTGKPKPLYLKKNWSKFARFHSKIRRIEVPLIANVSDPWKNEDQMRREGLRLAMNNISSTTPYLLLTSDVDEIPKAEFMRSLHHCAVPYRFPPFVLQCDFYYYSYEFKNEAHPWIGTTMSYVDSLSSTNISGETLRKDRSNFRVIPQSCFHCTWCFDQLKAVRYKMAAYSHTEHNQKRFRTQQHILNRYRHGKDLFDRSDQIYVYQNNNQDLPQLLKKESRRFRYMISRSNMTNLGFIDA